MPTTHEAKKVGDNWDPAKDEAAGEQCKSYGAPAIMAVPTRLRVSWLDDNTLKIETDAGTQTRQFRFGSSTALRASPPTRLRASRKPGTRIRTRYRARRGASLPT